MKKLILFFASILCYSLVSAQNIPNPYASIGKPAPKMVTLSNGAYDEFLLKEPIVLINGDAINRKTGELVYSQEENPKEIEQLKQQQEDKFRFLSIDPLTNKFSMLTPYQYASNRPIDGIDIDGLEHASYTVKLNDQGKVVQKIETSQFIKEVGTKGWGTVYAFYDSNNNKVFEIFQASEPPAIWTGAGRPLYISGKKILGNYRDMEEEEGFYNGGWQTLLSSVGLAFGVGEIFVAEGALGITFGALSTAASVDDLISVDGKSLSENLLGNNETAKGVVNLSKGALGFRNAVSSTLSLIKNGFKVETAVSGLMDAYGGIENFQKAYENYKTEMETYLNKQQETSTNLEVKKTND